MNHPSIRAHGISRRYGDTIALRTTNLDIDTGLTVIMGKSGSGKSSLLAVLAGIEKPNTGNVTHYDGETEVFVSDFRKDKWHDFSERREKEKVLQARTAFVPQRPALNPSQTIQDNIRLLVDKNDIQPDKSTQDAIFEGLGLEEFAAKFPREVSGGQNQRAALAVALLVMPEIVFLDEVTSGLDADNSERTYGLLRQLVDEQGMNVILASHDPRSAYYADQLIRLDSGRLKQNIVVAASPLWVPDSSNFTLSPQVFDPVGSIDQVQN